MVQIEFSSIFATNNLNMTTITDKHDKHDNLAILCKNVRKFSLTKTFSYAFLKKFVLLSSNLIIFFLNEFVRKT